MTKLVLLGHLSLEQQVRDISDAMHAALERIEDATTEADRNAVFYGLRERMGEMRRKFYADFRHEYSKEPELHSLWPESA